MTHAAICTPTRWRSLPDWAAPDHGQDALREAFLGFLAARADATARSCVPGHLTASAVVLDASRTSVLLTLHPRVGRWLQLGGHCEDGDTTIAGAALREATEESGHRRARSSTPSRCTWTCTRSPAASGSRPGTSTSGTGSSRRPERWPAISAESDDLRFWPLDACSPHRPQPRAAVAALRAAEVRGHSGHR